MNGHNGSKGDIFRLYYDPDGQTELLMKLHPEFSGLKCFREFRISVQLIHQTVVFHPHLKLA